MVTITWDNETDWDNAQSEQGVVHESVTNTDHNNSGLVKKGYSAESPYLSASLSAYWPFHENSGGTANDFSGNNNNGNTVNGTSQGDSGLLGTTAYGFDGVDDYVEVPDDTTLDGLSEITISFWTYINSYSSSDDTWVNKDDSGFNSRTYRFFYETETPSYKFAIGNGSGDYVLEVDGTVEGATGEWVHLACRYNGSSGAIFENGTNVGSTTGSVSIPDTNTTLRLGSSHDGRTIDGRMWDVRIYNTALSTSEIGTIYDVVAQDSSLTTGTKRS